MQNRKFADYVKALVLSLTALVFCGCATVSPTVGSLLPDRGARIAVNPVGLPAGVVLPSDAAAALGQAVEAALKENGIGAPVTGEAHNTYILEVTVAGAASERADRPVDLFVTGQLRKGGTPAVAATVVRRKTVVSSGGGILWPAVWTDVAAEIAEELRVRLHGEGHIVRLPSQAELAEASVPVVNPVKIRLYPIQDGRRDKTCVGYRIPAVGVPGEPLIVDHRRVNDYLLDLLRDDLQRTGYTIVNDREDFRVAGLLRLFWLWTEQTPLYWDIIGEIEFVLEVIDPVSGNSKTVPLIIRKQERSYVSPSPVIYEKVAADAVTDLLLRVRSSMSTPIPPR